MEEFINRFVSKVVYFFANQRGLFADNLSLLDLSPLQIVVDIAAISILFYTIMKWVQGTRAVQIIMGIVFLGAIYMFSVIFELIALNALFKIFFPAIIIAIPIVFQQELRRGLEYLGQKGLVNRNKKRKQSDMINTLVEAVKVIKNKKKGALIVIEKMVPLKDYIETGVMLDAKVSLELILSIFLSKAPLHDGAVIVRGERIVSAGSVLPFSEKIQTIDYGTRHKSALGLSEVTDALIIIVSEEKKEIGVAYEGKLHNKLSTEKLSQMISTFYKKHVKKPLT